MATTMTNSTLATPRPKAMAVYNFNRAPKLERVDTITNTVSENKRHVSSMSTRKLQCSLQTACSSADFYSGVDVWIRRPNVVNRKLLGSVTSLEGTLPPTVDLTAGHVTVGALFQQEGVGDGPKILVRELLPRVGLACRLSTALELVVTGTGGIVCVTNCRMPSLMLLQIAVPTLSASSN